MIVRRLPNSTLYHSGIKGQKWGVRRYQNEDGSLTSAGVQRYRKSREDYDSSYRDTQNRARQRYMDSKVVSLSSRNKNPLPDAFRGDIARKDGYREAMKDKAHLENENRLQRQFEQGQAEAKEAEERRKNYKEEALNSLMKTWVHKSEKKNVIHQMKVFGQAFKEVHTENINKGVNFVKKLFKK